MLQTIRNLLQEKLGDAEFDVGISDVPEHGHVSTNVAFVLAGEKNIGVGEAAEALKKHLEENAPKNFFEKIEIANGFLNFWLTKEALQDEFERIVKTGNRKQEAGNRVIVEYSQPNIAKPLHVGHLRSTIIGDALANVLEFAGHKVIRWNYLGDWGTQFGNVIAAYKLWGKKEEVEKAPVEVLADLYARFHEEAKRDTSLTARGREEFQKLEAGDKENRTLWEWFKKESLKELGVVYAMLGVGFDIWIGESFYEKKLDKLIERLKKEGVAKESEGALIVPFDKAQGKPFENLPPALIRKSDGATLYLTRDIANLEYRLKKYKPERVLYVVDNGQSLHFEQLFQIAEKLGLKGAELTHVKFGLVLSSDMKKLSTRTGGAISLMEVIEEAIHRAKKVVEEKQRIRQAHGEPELSEKEKEEIARVVGVGALKYNDLSQNRQSDIAFDWDRMLSLEGNSGPYLQYTYARLKSILCKAGKVPKFKKEALQNDADIELVLKLASFPDVVSNVSQHLFPHYLANYLHELARTVNSYYEKEPVLKAEEGLRALRLNLVSQAAETMKTGLALLGIQVVERM